MKTYKVLWIDDEYEKQDGFVELAELNDIVISCFKTSILGMMDLKRNLLLYDAVILDAKGFDKSENEVAKLTGLMNSISQIKELSSKRVIPYFIFSGQLDVIDNVTVNEMLGDLKIYRKSIDNDLLFIDLKLAADQNVETQIRHENQKFFEVISDYDTEVSKTLLNILKGIKNGTGDFDDKLYFTQLRIILEFMFRRANKIGLLHDACINHNTGKVNLTDASLFLSGLDTKNSRVRCTITHFPKIISEIVKNILYTTGAASHTTVADITQNMDIQDYRKIIQTPYLLFSLTYQLMDVLIWFNEYAVQYNNIAANRLFWQTIEYNSDGKKWISGEIVRISQSNWGTLKSSNDGLEISIPPPKTIQNNLTIGQKIKVTIEEKNHIVDIK